MRRTALMVWVLVCTASLLAAASAQTLRYFSWEPNIADETRELIAEFEAMHPRVRIEFEALPPDQYWPRMSALAAANRLPDVFYMSSGFIAEWHDNGLLANLQLYADELDLEEYYAGVLSTARFPDRETGDLHAIPINWVGTVLYYNKTAFDEAGVAYPSADWTWDDFLEAARALTVDKTGDGRIDQWGFWLYGRYAQIEPWIFQNGGHILNETQTRLEVDAAAREALQFLSDLVNVHEVAPPPREMEGVRQQDVFPLGLAAMWVDGSWNISNNRNIIGDSFEWDIAMVPRGPQAEEDIAYTWPDMLAIAPTTQHMDLAWEFVKFMTGPSRDAGYGVSASRWGDVCPQTTTSSRSLDWHTAG